MTLPHCLILAAAMACQSSSEKERVIQSDFTVVDNPNTAESGFSEFDRLIDVFGLSVYAESGVSDAQMLYVANVFAELLDNDENGVIDDTAVYEQLRDAEALMPIFNSEGSSGEAAFMDGYEGDGVSAVLYKGEVDPSQPGHWGADATVEELMHTINHVGHVSVYPAAFSLEPGSSKMTEAMDVARGGQFTNVPASYPEEAWYHYDDTTCDYACMAIEYLYWAQVSLMGILDDPDTCAGIDNEWELCSPTLFETGDVLMHALITDLQYKLPRFAPDGLYDQN